MVSTAPSSLSHLPKANNAAVQNVAIKSANKNNTAASAAIPPPTPIVPAYSSSTATNSKGAASDRSRAARSGRWTPDEKLLFLHGLKVFGRGRWKKIRQFLPTRTLIQIKSHAQKVLKREESGDDIFLPLRANKDKVEALIKDKSRLFQNSTPSLAHETSSNYGYGKPLPTCPTFFRPPTNAHGIAPFSFVPSDKINSSESQQRNIHQQPSPSSGHSLYHNNPTHTHHPHQGTHRGHMYHHPTVPPPSLQQQNNTSSSHLSRQKLSQNHLSSMNNLSSGGSIHQVPLPTGNGQGKTTDVLAATALCELFRGNNEEAL